MKGKKRGLIVEGGRHTVVQKSPFTTLFTVLEGDRTHFPRHFVNIDDAGLVFRRDRFQVFHIIRSTAPLLR